MVYVKKFTPPTFIVIYNGNFAYIFWMMFAFPEIANQQTHLLYGQTIIYLNYTFNNLYDHGMKVGLQNVTVFNGHLVGCWKCIIVEPAYKVTSLQMELLLHVSCSFFNATPHMCFPCYHARHKLKPSDQNILD